METVIYNRHKIWSTTFYWNSSLYFKDYKSLEDQCTIQPPPKSGTDNTTH